MWKFSHFPATLILREINIGWFQTVENCHFDNFGGFEIWFFWNFTIEIIHGQAKKIIWGTSSQGTTQKICRPPLAAGKFFRQPCRPRVQNDQNFFTHGIPMVYSQGSFISTFLPGLTTQGSFLRFFLIFSEFSWFFPIFHEFLPKNLPAAFGGQKFFPPLGSWPLPKFFYP